jgi:hypothetical protein
MRRNGHHTLLRGSPFHPSMLCAPDDSRITSHRCSAKEPMPGLEAENTEDRLVNEGLLHDAASHRRHNAVHAGQLIRLVAILVVIIMLLGKQDHIHACQNRTYRGIRRFIVPADGPHVHAV